MNSEHSFRSKVAYLLSILKKQGSLVVIVLAIEVVLSLSNAVIPYFTKLQIDQLEQRSSQLWGIGGLSPFLLFAGLIIIPSVIELIRLVAFERMSRSATYKFDIELQLETEKSIWSKLATLDVGFFENRRNQRIISNTIASTRVTNDFFRFLRSRIGNVTTVLAIFPLLGLVSWQLLLLVAVVTVLQLVLSEVSRKQEIALNTLQDRQREKYWKVEYALTYHFHTLLSLGATESMLEKYRELAREREQLDLKRENAQELLRTVEWLLRNGLTVIANLFVGYQVLLGQLSIGTFTLVLSYTIQLNTIFRDILESMRTWKYIELQFDRLQFFSFLKPRIVEKPDAITVIESPNQLVMDDVHFAYPSLFAEEREYLKMIVKKTQGFLTRFSYYYDQTEFDEWQEYLRDDQQKEKVLNGVSLTIAKNKVVALLGRNGAGKTTITHLLMHHYEPVAGKILLDGTPLHAFKQSTLVEQFATIHQTPFILQQFSVRENVLLGVKRSVSDDEIWQLLAKLDLADAVKKLPKGLDTVLGEGTNLSGGQEQLVAVARVLLQQRPFIIFDEGMNQLDIEHETKVMELLKSQAESAGILYITHRITTARKADYIYMLDQGVIVEEGTHQELLEKKGLYASFWQMQVIE